MTAATTMNKPVKCSEKVLQFQQLEDQTAVIGGWEL